MSGSEPWRDGKEVLIVAPNASSRFGGEAFLPLKYFQILHRRGIPVRLIAHARNRANLEEVLKTEIGALDFIEDSVWHRLIWTVGRWLPGILRDTLAGTALNFVNEAYQRRLIRRLVRAGRVCLIHQPIPVSPKAPSSLYGFGVPVIIGPMNGGMAYPPGYADHESATTRAFVDGARRLAVLLNRLVPGKRRAAALLVANERTRAALPIADHPHVIELVENGVDLTVWASPAVTALRKPGDPFRLVFMRRLVGWKAVDITFEALRLARDAGVDVRLDVLGDGEERAELEALSRSLGLAEVVTFLGFRPQAECARRLAEADALILNSVYECGGAVVLEAMGLARPVIASDWGGPADYLDETCGILVHPAPRETFAQRISAAINRLADDPALCRALGEAGRARIIADFDWEKKVDRMIAVYTEVCHV